MTQTPPPFVMTQINEIKRNTLPNFIYAFLMSTANLIFTLAVLSSSNQSARSCSPQTLPSSL